jgi:hypothetical protein
VALIAADLAFAVAALFVAVQLVVAVVNARAFPRLPAPPATRPAEAPRVSILVPARDEADTLPETLPRWLRQGADEVIVLNDASTDGTGAILSRAAADASHLRVLDGDPLPAGWNGKNWACHQLARAARGELLVFTDADVRWEEGALDALLLAWTRHRPGLLTVWPRQRTGGLYERLVVPQVDMILLGALPHPAVRLPFATLAGANGQLMAWTRAAYDRVGGHAAVRGEVLEDVRLAQRAKAAGVRLHLALGHPLLSTRMYRGAGATVRGFAKNVLAAAGSAPVLVALTLLNLLAYTAAWPLALLQPRWAAVAAGGLALRALTAARSGRSPLEAPLQPLAPLALLPIVGVALARRGGYVWRGRRYPAEGTR